MSVFGRYLAGFALASGWGKPVQRGSDRPWLSQQSAARSRAGQPGAILHNVPVQLTSFVGREEELARARDLLGGTRMLTLTGAGGAGKTRLALEVATQLALEGTYPGGVWLVEFAALVDARLVLQTVAAALGRREEAARPVIGTLVAALGQR